MTTLYRTHTYRLYPTNEQERKLVQWVGTVRAVYNVALEQRRDWYKPGRRFNCVTQGPEVTALRSEFDWIRDVPASPLHQALRDLDRAYQNWWSGRAKAPTPRKRGQNDSMRFQLSGGFSLRRVSTNWGRIDIPKLGSVRFRWDREITGKVKTITVLNRAGVWTITAPFECEAEGFSQAPSGAIGIDRGIAVFAALSDGTQISALNVGKKARRSLVRAQRKLSRKKKGSANRKKAALRLAKIHMRVANARKDFLHKLTTDIAQNHGTVVVEALKVRNMTASARGTVDRPGRNVRAKSGLNRSILDQGWGMFRTMLAYKLAARGGRLIEVPAAYTSQTCASCGVVDARSRVSQSRFICIGCGHEANADTNAAINILAAGHAVTACRGTPHKRPDEAGTIRRAA